MRERILLAREMKLCDEYTISTLGVPSRTLMERASDAVVKEIMRAELDISRTVVICGSGNNGGDGFAAARFLAQSARESGIDADIKLIFVGREESMTAECLYQRKAAACAGIDETDELPCEGVTLVIDALLGIGLDRMVEGRYKEIIEAVNTLDACKVSVDIPSGINADTGEIMGAAVRADMTLTIAAFKRGLLLYPGAEYCGKLIKADIGIGTEALENEPSVFTSLASPPFPLPRRFPFSNKGDYGKVLIVGGAKNMAGAAYLSALAAYRTGAGLVRIFSCEENRVILQTLLPEAVLITYNDESDISDKLAKAVSDSDSIVIGPGLSRSEEAEKQLWVTLEKAECPLVIDADALNILSAEHGKELPKLIKAPSVITPHMGEMARLTGMSISDLKKNAIDNAIGFAEKKGVVCCMKDARTAVSDGRNVYLNTSGSNGMSKGGSGDVLTGVISALLAQKMTPFEAACTGVYLHGKAGETAAYELTEYSLLARDIAEHIPNAVRDCGVL